MSRNPYTASERRGIILVALLALSIIASGIVLSLCGRPRMEEREIPVIVEHPEMIDTVHDATGDTNITSKRSKEREKKESKKKTYRRRSPLDEPV